MGLHEPIFITGMRKSGTSLVRCLFDSHPELFVYPPNELHMLRYGRDQGISKRNDTVFESPAKTLEEVVKFKYLQRMNDPESQDYRETIDVDAITEECLNANPETLKEAYEVLFIATADHTSGYSADDITNTDLRPVSKTVMNSEFFPILKDWFRDMKMIYVLRNPYGHWCSARNSIRPSDKDGNFSMLQHPFPFLGGKMRRMNNSYRSADTYEREFPDQFKILVFDDLLKNPEETMREIADWLGIEFCEELTKPTIIGEHWRGNSKFKDGFEGISTSPLDHWEDSLSKGEARVVRRISEGILEKYGFERQPEGSIYRPWSLSERPQTYLGNRFAAKWEMNRGFKISESD